MNSKRLLYGLLASTAVMLLLPALVVRLVPGDAGMAACMLLFYAINPLYCALSGWFAGKDKRRLWPLPVAAAALFLTGAWLVFDPGETLFAVYAGIYLIIGLLFLLLRR